MQNYITAVGPRVFSWPLDLFHDGKHVNMVVELICDFIWKAWKDKILFKHRLN